MNSSAHGILSLNLHDAPALQAAYMPFIENGGVFVPTTRSYEVGDQVFVLLDLMNEPERLPFTGTVAWITPARAQNGKTQGIGLRFNERDSPVRRKIELQLSRCPSAPELRTQTL